MFISGGAARHVTPAAGLIVAVNATVFVLERIVAGGAAGWAAAYGLRPLVLMQGEVADGGAYIDPYMLTLVSAPFLHAGLGHLAVNMACLAAIGPVVERRVGWWRFLLVWAAACSGGAMVHAVTHANSMAPLIGASGGVAGLVGVLLLSGPAGVAAGGLWVAIQLAELLVSDATAYGPQVAWAAHLGGFGVGGMVALLVRWGPLGDGSGGREPERS